MIYKLDLLISDFKVLLLICLNIKANNFFASFFQRVIPVAIRTRTTKVRVRGKASRKTNIGNPSKTKTTYT